MMWRMLLVMGIAVALLGGIPSTGQANLIINGDFEDTTEWGVAGDPLENGPAGWRDSPTMRFNAATPITGANAIGGAGTSAYFPADAGVAVADRRDNVQLLDSMSGAKYRLTMDFASTDPGGEGDRSLSMSTRDGENRALRTSFRINGDGDFQSFSGTWQTLLPGAVVFDDDLTESPLVHHLVFTVDSIAGNFDLSITDSNGVVHAVTESTLWRGTPPMGAGYSGIEFNTFISSGDYLIDNLSVESIPEPATVALLALAVAGGGMRWRRR